MSVFDDLLEADALEHIKALGATVETYTFRDGTTKSIYVLIDRNPTTTYGSGMNFSPTATLYFCANDTDGVANPILGAETITIKGRQSDSAAKTYTVGDIASQDAGLWQIVVPVQG